MNEGGYEIKRYKVNGRKPVDYVVMRIPIAGKKCHYCLTELTYENATLDHMRPRVKGGGTDPQNLVLACLKCNQMKTGLPYEYFIKNRKAIVRANNKQISLNKKMEDLLNPPKVKKWWEFWK